MSISLSATELRELELAISDRIYLRVEKWNLYLGDAVLAKELAIECNANINSGPSLAAKKAFESVQVNLGEGTTKLPMARMISSAQFFELEEILSPYCR